MRLVSILKQTGQVLTVFALANACKPKQHASNSAPSASTKATPALPPGVDAALLGKLNEISKGCKVDVSEGSVNCPQGEHRTLISEFIANTRSRTGAVATLAYALHDETLLNRAVAANVLYSAFRSPWGPDLHRGAVTDADASALLTATLALPKTQARQAIPAAVHAAMLSNQASALYTALDKSNESQLRVIASRYLMTHGRLDSFPKVQELSRDPNSAVALAALESPENMFNWTAAEQEAICPWAQGLLSDNRPPVAAKALALLGNCSGAFVDKLLEGGEASLKSADFSTPQLAAFRDLCAPSRRAQPNGPSEAQCQRSRKLLEKVVDSKALSEQVRGSALISLAYQWADEETLKFAQSETKSSNKSLAEHAQRTVERLTQRLHPPKAATNSPKPAIAPVRAAGAAVAPRAVPTPVAPTAAPALPTPQK